MNSFRPTNLDPQKLLTSTLLPSALALACAIAYANSLAGSFLFDDATSILQNRAIRRLWPPGDILDSRRPIVNLTLAVNYAISGFDPWGYHFVNVIIHSLAALTLYGIVRRTLGRASVAERYRHAAHWLAFATALLWAVHPLHTQSVTYVIQRSESLMGLFYLLTIYCVVRGAASVHAGTWHLAAVAACALSMGSKAVAVTAPFMVLLYDRTVFASSFRRAICERWSLYTGLAATLSVPVFSGVFRGVVSPGTATATVGFGFKGISPLEYALTQPGVILHYLLLSCWPGPLCIDYGWPVAASVTAVAFPASIVVVMLALTCWAFWRRAGLGLAGASFFLLLSPTSSLVPIKDPLFEHRMYLPLAAVVGLLVMGGYVGLLQLRRQAVLCGRGGRLLPAALMVAAALALGHGTIRRNRDYHTPVSMWQDVVAKRPENARGWDNLGVALSAAGRHEDAVRVLRQGFVVDPNYVNLLANLGAALNAVGRHEEALQVLQRGLRVDPYHVNALSNLGAVLSATGRVEDAAKALNQALQFDSNHVDALCNLGAVRINQSRIDDALELLHRAAAWNPTHANTRRNLGVALFEKGDLEGSIAELKKAIRLAPHFDEAHHNLNVALSALLEAGRGTEAVNHYRNVVALAPSRIGTRVKLANALFAIGKLDEAIKEYVAVLRINSRLSGVHFNLGVACLQQGKVAKAIQALRQALRLRPDYAEAHFFLGNALAQAGKLAEAAREYRATLQHKPSHEAARAALKAIKRRSDGVGNRP